MWLQKAPNGAKEERMAIKNLTPHQINLFDEEGNLIVSIPSHGIARVSVKREVLYTLPFEHKLDSVDIRVNKTKFGQVENLPEPDGKTIYIVSMVVAKALPYREDLICPDETIRDKDGNIIGCKAFCRP